MKKLRDYFNKNMTWGDFWKMYAKCYGIGMIIGFFYIAWIMRARLREWIDEKIHKFKHRNDPIDIYR